MTYDAGLSRVGRLRALFSCGKWRMFERGATYTRKEIQARVGGSLQTYLPHVAGRVVAACLRHDRNPDAPAVILVGQGAGIERAAALLAAQQSPVPMFLRRSAGVWEYVGQYAVVRSSQTEGDLLEQARRSGRAFLTRVIYMEAAP